MRNKKTVNGKILHVDGDSFFVACELAWRPELRGKPVVVGEERGIVSALSVEAKQLGIHRAQPIFQVKESFPEVVVLPGHFELYKEYSRRLFSLLSRYIEVVEWYSIDECFAFVPEITMQQFGSWQGMMEFLKHTIQTRLGITFSFGLADTKPLAKIASKFKKPNGLTIIQEENREQFLESTSIDDVWGVGWKTAEKLHAMHIYTALDFIRCPLAEIQRYTTTPVVILWHELQGRFIRDVVATKEPQKSLQATRSFAATSDESFVYAELSRNVEIVCRRMRNQKVVTRFISFYCKPKSTIYSRQSVQIELPMQTNNPAMIMRAIRPYFSAFFKNNRLYRSTGIACYGLIASEFITDDLFGFTAAQQDKDTVLSVIDCVEKKIGTSCINLASSLASVQKRNQEHEQLATRDPYIWNLPVLYMGEVV